MLTFIHIFASYCVDPAELACVLGAPRYSRRITIDLDAFPPAVKLALIAVGEEFGSDDTFAQATQTGQGLEKYGDILRLYGLPLSDGKRLGEAREMLSEAGYGRNQAMPFKVTMLRSTPKILEL